MRRLARRLLPLAFVALAFGAGAGCDRLKQSAAPPGVPANAREDRTRRIWEAIDESGVYRAFFYDGQLAGEGRLLDNRRTGEWKTFTLDGRTVAARGKYVNGLRDGLWEYFDDSGQLYLSVEYKLAPRREFGLLQTDDYGNENGPYRRYFPDGALEESGAFWSGFYQGPVVRYYRNGQVAFRGAYERDQPVGAWTYYYPDGDVEREETYVNGQLDGVLRNYYPGRKLYHETVFKNGVEVGPKKIYPHSPIS